MPVNLDKTVYHYVKAMLASTDSDEVSSVGDTTESRDMVDILRRCYEQIIQTADLPEHYVQTSLKDRVVIGESADRGEPT